jgi:heme exporter protein C
MNPIAIMPSLANPQRFLSTARRLLPWIAGVAVLFLGIGLYLALIVSPADYQQGEGVRIMYVHVPSAWLALLCYTLMAGASAWGFIARHPLADMAAKSLAPIGAVFTALALITGSLWGKPMWGAWWAWGDARLVSVLVLFFLYLGYMALWAVIEEPSRAARAAGILAIVGFVDLPIIKFSVDWWATLHQKASVFRLEGPTIAPSMLWPLLVMATGFTAFAAVVLLLRMEMEILNRRLRALRLQAASGTAWDA